MMRWDTFGRSALFAAVAAALWLPWMMTVGPILGAWRAHALFLGVAMAGYIGGLAPGRATPARRLGIASVAGLAACGLALGAQTAIELALALAALLGLARSGVLYRTTPARAVAIELGLLGGGLLFARHLSGSGALSTPLALWGFLLVQSLFFVIAGTHPRTDRARHADPFDAAHGHAVALLDRDGV